MCHLACSPGGVLNHCLIEVCGNFSLIHPYFNGVSFFFSKNKRSSTFTITGLEQYSEKSLLTKKCVGMCVCMSAAKGFTVS